MSGDPLANDLTPIFRGLDAVIEVYKRSVDRTLLRENLELTPDERVRRLVEHLVVAEELRRAGRARRPRDLEVIAELEALDEESGSAEHS